MKIGILTFPGSPSHGASLQMYALYQTLFEMKQDVEIIHYIPDTVNHRRVRTKPSIKKCILTLAIRLLVKSNKPHFKRFEGQMALYPDAPIRTTEQLAEVLQRYDRIIVGSDQVWNPVVTGNDMNYYLKCCDNDEKKAAYAPSFGTNDVAEADRDEIAALLDRFRYLSVREQQGADIILRLTGRSVPVVLDPTLLLSRQDWLKIAKPAIKHGPERYVLYYTIKPSPALLAFAEQFAKQNGCLLMTVGGRIKDKYKKGKHPVFGVGPAELLGLIQSAEYVITNSFHGLVMSLVLEKNFYVEYSTDTNSRLINMVNAFGLDDAVVRTDTLNAPPIVLDYERLRNTLVQKRRDSLEYLQTIIGENR